MKFKNSMSIFLIAALVLIFTEISLRAWVFFSRKVIFSELVRDDPVLDWRLSPYYYNNRRNIRINSRGFRGPELNNRKEDCIRIITIGDSCTFGEGSSSDEFTYPRLLEKKLEERLPSKCYQVINAGVPGYTSKQCLLYLKNELLDFKPDVIIVYCGYNDIWTYKNPYDNTAALPLLRDISRTLSKSLTFVLLRNYFLNPLRRELTNLTSTKTANNNFAIDKRLRETALRIYENNLKQIAKLAYANRIKMIIVTLPTVIRGRTFQNTNSKFSLPMI